MLLSCSSRSCTFGMAPLASRHHRAAAVPRPAPRAQPPAVAPLSALGSPPAAPQQPGLTAMPLQPAWLWVLCSATLCVMLWVITGGFGGGVTLWVITGGFGGGSLQGCRHLPGASRSSAVRAAVAAWFMLLSGETLFGTCPEPG